MSVCGNLLHHCKNLYFVGCGLIERENREKFCTNMRRKGRGSFQAWVDVVVLSIAIRQRKTFEF